MLRVRNWGDHFENNRTRELKYLDWVPVKNRFGEGYATLMDHENGAAHFGCWIAIVEIASTCDVRGTLSKNGGQPYDIRSLARYSRIPEGLMAEAVHRLIHEVSWLEEIPEPSTPKALTEISQDDATIPHPPAVIPHGPAEKRLRNGTERNGINKTRAKTNSVSNSAGILQICTQTLRDTSELMARVNREANRKKPLVSGSDCDRLRVLGAAERAIEGGTNPAALFVHIVKHAKWGLISQAQEDRAADRLRAYRAQAGTSSFAATLASQLRLPTNSGGYD